MVVLTRYNETPVPFACRTLIGGRTAANMIDVMYEIQEIVVSVDLI